MQDLHDEPALRRMQRQLHHEVEHGIRDANREVIHARIPELHRDRFLQFATVVARLRANYLCAALEVIDGAGDGDPNPEAVANLQGRRRAFEETRDAFEALQRAIERGYLDVVGIDS